MKKINRNGSLFKCFWQEIVVIITSIALFVTLGVLKKKQDDIDVSIETSNATVSGVTYEDVLYVVKEGDSLSLIAEYFGVPMDVIINTNNIAEPNQIAIGSKLTILNVNSDIVKKYKELQRSNKVDIKYVVVADDSINSIAIKFNVSADSIIKCNNIINPNAIYVGSVLTIPSVDKEIANKYSISKNNISNNLPDGYVRGIDISSWNGNLNWDLMEQHYKAGKFSYVIIRMAENYNSDVGKREFTLDSCFEKNLSECNKRGIPYGVYVFSRGANEEEINTETKSIIHYINNNLNKTKVINGETLDLSFNLSLPFYMDCFEEDARSQYGLYASGKYDECVKLIKLWCDEMEDAGYFTGVYCGAYFAKDMGINRLSDYSLWLAHYGNRKIGNVEEMGLNGMVTFSPIVKSQQVTDSGMLDGIECKFDVNITDEKLILLVQSFYDSQKRTNGYSKKLVS